MYTCTCTHRSFAISKHFSFSVGSVSIANNTKLFESISGASNYSIKNRLNYRWVGTCTYSETMIRT